jgi:hypothetical protein
VQEAVFLHHLQLRCALPMASRQDLFCPDGLEADTGLPAVSSRLLEPGRPTRGTSSAPTDPRSSRG